MKTQKTTDIGRLSNGLRSRAEMLISLCENQCLLHSFEHLFNSCVTSIKNGGKIIICGNGGFAAIAQHTASELMGKLHAKRIPISAIALGTDMSVLTCIANDFGYERVFSRQLEAFGNPTDTLIALTTSGKSKNILQSLSQAKAQKINSFAFTGKDCSGLCKELGAFCVELPTKETEAIQDLTMILLHLLCDQIESELLGDFRHDAKSLWDKIAETGRKHNATVLILDRDGVINHLLPNAYLLSPSELSINEDFLKVSPVLTDVFDKILIVTNQACIGKGLAEKEQVDRINTLICDSVHKAGGRIDATYTCPDSDPSSKLRKPNVGIAEIILKDYPDIDFTKSIMVGDSFSDELFAERLGSMYFNIYNV